MTIRNTLLGAFGALALAATPAAAVTGSGTVAFNFTAFIGPFARQYGGIPSSPSTWQNTGTINGVTPFYNGYDRDRDLGLPDFPNYILGYAPMSGSVADFAYAGGYGPNQISFTPGSFTNIAQGEDFVLGTIDFTNGGWFGGERVNPNAEVPSAFYFTLTTSSTTAAFNQSFSGLIQMNVHAPAAGTNDCSVLAGQEAEADWISVLSNANLAAPKALRVYDEGCLPAGETNHGTVDLIGRFGSLHVVGLANPGGSGFLTDGNAPLPSVAPPPPPAPPTTGGVPEPASWGLMIAGFAATGGMFRRRKTRIASDYRRAGTEGRR